MKYYSDKTKKYYEEDQLDVLKADEEAFDKENQKLEVAKAERAERAKEVEEAYKVTMKQHEFDFLCAALTAASMIDENGIMRDCDE